MIHNGVVYLTAGKSSYLDGGIRFYMLDPTTGKVLNEKTLYTEQRNQYAYAEGVLSDLLVSDGDALFMRHLHIDPKTLEAGLRRVVELFGTATREEPTCGERPIADLQRALRVPKERPGLSG